MSNELSALDIFKDDGTGYTVAGHILAELAECPQGLEVRELSPLIGDGIPNKQFSHWLRRMRERGEVHKVPVYRYATNHRFRWRAGHGG